MLTAVVGFTWRDRKTNNELYGELSNVTSVLKVRRLKFIGHMCRRKQGLVCQMLMRKPNQETRKRGRPAMTYVVQLKRDTGLSTEELKNIRDERELWRILVNDVRVCSKQVK